MVADVEVSVVHLQPVAAAGPASTIVPALACNILNERPVNGRPDELCGCNRYPIELTKTNCYMASEISWVSRRCDAYKLVDGIRDKLGYMNTNLGQDSVDQLEFR